MAGKKKGATSERQVALKAKLMELAPGRLTRTVRALRNVGKLARYNPTPNQTQAAFAILAKELDAAHKRWQAPAAPEGEISVTIPDA